MKGFNVNIRVVAAAVLAFIMILVVINGFSNINSSAEGQANDTNSGVNEETEDANCLLECRRENPSGGIGFQSCKDTRCS